jgi:hypothetical protein
MHQPFHRGLHCEEKEKKFELTRLTLQTKLTRQTWDSRHESLITK